MKPYKVLTINPGSTSTKVALFQGEECLYSQTVSHEAKELEQYASMSEQLPYRRDTVLTLLKEAGIRLEEVDVFVGRGGGLIAMEGGTYGVTASSILLPWVHSWPMSLPRPTAQKQWW